MKKEPIDIEAREAELIRLSLDGDKEAVGRLLELHYPMMMRVALKYTGRRAMAEDAVQNACLQVLRSMHQFRAEARFSSWVRRIVVNSALMLHRKDKRLVFVGGAATGSQVTDTSTPERIVSVGQQYDAVEKVLKDGWGEVYDVFYSRFIDGRSLADISEEMGVTVGAIKTRYTVPGTDFAPPSSGRSGSGDSGRLRNSLGGQLAPSTRWCARSVLLGFDEPIRAVILGGRNGIGGEFAKRILNDDLRHQVWLCSRDPDWAGALPSNVAEHRLQLDITSASDWERVSATLSEQGPINCVINASGLLHSGQVSPERTWRSPFTRGHARRF